MYIKKMNRKESGYVILVSIVILMLIVCISTFLTKIISNNYMKSYVIHTRDDIKSLSRIEAETMIQAEIYFKDNTLDFRKKVAINGEKARSLIVSISGSDGELIKDDGNGNHSHIKLVCGTIDNGNSKIVKLKPTGYRTEYIYKCTCVK